MGRLKDLTGQVFARLTVLSLASMDKRHQSMWNCICICGNTKIVNRGVLRKGEIKSCGCVRSLTTNGQPQTKSEENSKHRNTLNGRAGRLFHNAKGRARKYGVPFEITHAYVLELLTYAQHCPYLGIPIWCRNEDGSVSWAQKGNGPNNPSVDRIIPALGYVRGNLEVISHKANAIKSDYSLEELAARMHADPEHEAIAKRADKLLAQRAALAA
jgi:hypothetical protein